MNRAASATLLGLFVGALIGLYLGWFLFPLELVDVTPLDLETTYQADYVRLIASTYAADQDLEMARVRVQNLGRVDFSSWMMNETLNEILIDPNSNTAFNMVELAEALGLSNPNFAVVKENR